MPKCPNCDYLLVLLEHRRKYKCAKCGRLFLQQKVDSKEFREWNKKRREKAKKKALEESEEARREYKRELVIQNKDWIIAWKNQNKDKIKLYSKR